MWRSVFSWEMRAKKWNFRQAQSEHYQTRQYYIPNPRCLSHLERDTYNKPQAKTHFLQKAFCFGTFCSRLSFSFSTLLEVSHVDHGTCHLLIQLPESGHVWTLTLVVRPPGNPLEDFLVTAGAELLQVCAQVLGSLLSLVSDICDGRLVAAAWLDLLSHAGEGCESGHLCEGVSWWRRRSRIKEVNSGRKQRDTDRRRCKRSTQSTLTEVNEACANWSTYSLYNGTVYYECMKICLCNALYCI